MYGLYNIAEVVLDGLCTGCGTCAGVCPTDTIVMRVSNGLYSPEIEEAKCTRCRLCLECCPGYSVDFRKLNSKFFGKQPEDLFLGNYLKCHVGHSNDEEIRYNSSSGGLVTQLLVFALERGLIDGALVTRMRKNNPLEPRPFIARTREEIISASKSKYCPAATNEALRCVLKEDGRFAVVGLPCHIHGIRKAEENMKALKDRIVLHVGLMCSHTVSFSGTEFLLKKLGMSRERIAEIAYRGQGWPGSMLIKLRNHSHLSVPYVGRWNAYWPVFSCFFFTPMRCLMCPDETNELADISFGDAWLPESKNERNGESIVVTRTGKGEEILSLAYSSGAISLWPVKGEKVKRSQAEPLKFKKDDITIRLAMIESSGRKIPDFNPKRYSSSSSSLSSFARNLFVFFNVRASEDKILKRLLSYIPFPIIRLCYGVYKFLSHI